MEAMTYTVKIKVDEAKAQEIREFYGFPKREDPKNLYQIFQGKTSDGIQVTGYRNRKEIYTVTFQGPSEEEVMEEARQFSSALTLSSYENTARKEEAYYLGWDDKSNQIGSDEVGVGDFFGPLIVVATFVSSADIPFLEKEKVNDSKKMDDAYIERIGALVKRRIRNFVILVSPKKLSELEERKFSLHKVMAKCHNLAQKGLVEKYGLPPETIVYIDQFEPESSYRKLVGEEIIPNPLYFRPHGESYYPSVACASVIARYTFLEEWKKMEAHFHVPIPKGAGSAVDLTFRRLKNQYGLEAVTPYVKKWFRNYRSL